MQKCQPLAHHLVVEKIDAGRVTAMAGEAGYKTKPDRVFGAHEDDRDRRCCSFGRERSRRTVRGDHGCMAADHVSHQRRDPIGIDHAPSRLIQPIPPEDALERRAEVCRWAVCCNA
jgi:hypothetical protein